MNNFVIIYKTDFFYNKDEKIKRLEEIKEGFTRSGIVVLGPGEKAMIINEHGVMKCIE